MNKKILTVLVLLLLCYEFALAQPVKGDININAGIGTGFYYNIGSTISIPPIGASLDYNVDDRFSVGGMATYSTSSYNYGGYGKYKLSYFIIGARGNYHFVVNEKVDPYIGAILAFNIFDSKWKGTNVDPSFNFSAAAIIPGFYIGGRYLFKENLGAFAEIGYPMIRVGVTLKRRAL